MVILLILKKSIKNYSKYYFGELHNIFNKEEINRVFQSFKKEKWIGYINFKLLIKITELLKKINEKGIVNTKETLRDIELLNVLCNKFRCTPFIDKLYFFKELFDDKTYNDRLNLKFLPPVKKAINILVDEM